MLFPDLINNEKVVIEEIGKLKEQFNLSQKINFHTVQVRNIDEWEEMADKEIINLMKLYEEQLDLLIQLKERVVELNNPIYPLFENKIIKLTWDEFERNNSNQDFNDLSFIMKSILFPFEAYINTQEYSIFNVLKSKDNKTFIVQFSKINILEDRKLLVERDYLGNITKHIEKELKDQKKSYIQYYMLDLSDEYYRYFNVK